MKHQVEKAAFAKELKVFAATLAERITSDGEWTIRGFIDIFRNVYTISTDTKVVSKILELHLFPHFLAFAESIHYRMETATHQNWYPDLTFVSEKDPGVKFAVDLKTTYRDEEHPGFCNGFTLGSHGEYFVDRKSGKNIQYPYGEYSGHFCLGIIYTRAAVERLAETKVYQVDEIENMPAVIKNFLFFAEEKWRIASDKGGVGTPPTSGASTASRTSFPGTAFSPRQGRSCSTTTGRTTARLSFRTLRENGKSFPPLRSTCATGACRKA